MVEQVRYTSLIRTINAARIVLVAPHPDDEVLGGGVLIQRCQSQEDALNAVAVTDGAVSRHRDELCTLLMTTERPRDWCVAPWSRDGNPDHDACGDVVESVGAALGIRTPHHLAWAGNWAQPARSAIAWNLCRRLE